MLEFIAVFTKGGVVLWHFNSSVHNFEECINNVIRSVILEERSTESQYFESDNLAVQYKLDNELDLIYVTVFQKVLKLPYLDSLMNELQLRFKAKYGKVLQSSSQRLSFIYDFKKDYRSLLKYCENNYKDHSPPKSMRSFSDSLKSKKTVASLIEDKSSKIESSKKVNIQEKITEEIDTVTNDDLILENRKKLKEKLTAKKSPDTKSNSAGQEKTGKQPRIWELGGKSKDAPVLNRSRDTEDSGEQYDKIQTSIVGSMQGNIRALEEENESENDEDEESDVDDTNRKAASSQDDSKNTSGILSYFKGIVGSKNLTRSDLQVALDKMRDHLISKNVASDIAYKLCESVATSLEGKSRGTFDTIASLVKSALTTSLVRILSPKRRIDIIRDALEAKKNGRPYTIIFCGVNGVGKSTNLAKICFWLIENNFSVLIAACDTFRAGAVEQLRTHTRHLNTLHPAEEHNNCKMVELYEKGYGKDSAGIAMEAIKFAKDTQIDVVLVDTAGRMQNNEPLMRSLSKLIKVNDPNLVLFVGEALVGNEAVDQLVKFNQALADYSSDENPHTIDGIVLTKFDTIDDKVGAAISMTYITGQPIVFIGTGQTYADLKALNVNAVVNSLMK